MDSSNNEPTITTIDNVPDQILIEIFESFSGPERIRLERVSKKWKELSLRSWSTYRCVSDDFYFYERRTDKQNNNMLHALPKLNEQKRYCILKQLLCRGGKYVKSIEMKKSRQCPTILFVISQYCPNLESIQFNELDRLLSTSSLNSLSLYCHKLKVIQFIFCLSSSCNADPELGSLFRNCVHLTTLELFGIKITGSCFRHLALEMKSVSITLCPDLKNEEVRNLVDRCSQLEMLKLKWCSQIMVQTFAYAFRNLVKLRTLLLPNYETFEGIQISMPFSLLNSHLTELGLRCNEWVNNKVLLNISQSLFHLCKLDISSCNNVTDIGVSHLRSLERLTNVNVNCCNKITNDGPTSLANVGRLEVFTYSGCGLISSELIMELVACINLTTLDLFSCILITDNDVKMLANLHRLEVLLIRDCSRVTDDSLIALIQHCPNLKKLDLSESKITDNCVKMLVKLVHLEVLILQHCVKVTNKSMKELAKSKTLKRLDLMDCRKITMKTVLLFLNTIGNRSVRLSLYLLGTSVDMKIDGVTDDDSVIYLHPMLEILSFTKI